MFVGALASLPVEASDFVTFESDPVRPLALSANGRHLYSVNTPDGRLEVFRVDASGLRHVDSVPVGLEPVAAAYHAETRQVWVVNQLSDSVSVIDVSRRPMRVVRTLQVGDEPRDIVFAGPRSSRAFISTAHRGQHAVDPTGQFAEPGVGRADVWVFDVEGPSTPRTVVTLFGDKPRPLAVSPDGSIVYAGVYRSGNQTAIVKNHFNCGPFEDSPPCTKWDQTFPGGLPAPNMNHQEQRILGGSLIVQYDGDSAEWRDELGRDWSNAIPFDLPDYDVFAIAASADEPSEIFAWSGVGTILFNMQVHPITGRVYVSNTNANNRVRFEGPGVYAAGLKPEGEPATVQGHIHEARISILDEDGVRTRHLNKHIDYNQRPAPAGVAERSLATPMGMAFSADGARLYLAAFGSSKIGVFDVPALEANSYVPSAADHIELSVGGPTGLVLDERNNRLYVATRFDNAVVSVDLVGRTELQRIPLHNPEPSSVVDGRRFMYDARLTSSNGEASCSACHMFGDMDDLAWDLGDPDGDMRPNLGPRLVDTPLGRGRFHPMKGPMTTQSIRGLAGHGPLHWRGDRSGLFENPPKSSLDVEAAFRAFNPAFVGLVGRAEPLNDAEMKAFTDFALQITYPPNPIRRLDDSLRPNEAAGRDIFFERNVFGVLACNDCHRIDRSAGLFGTLGIHDGFILIKIPHLRNLYQKVGMFGMPSFAFNKLPSGFTGPQMRGFGFAHDGSEDRVARQISGLGFSLDDPQDVLDVEAFMMASPTNLAPVVGQQVTLEALSPGPPDPLRSPLSLSAKRHLHPQDDGEAREALNLLIERARTPFIWPDDPDARECDLVVHGVVGGKRRSWLLDASSPEPLFMPARRGEAPVTLETLLSMRAAGRGEPPARNRGHRAGRRRQSNRSGEAMTFTCGTPGSGVRMALDRDRDGAYDGDERRAHSDPADPTSVPTGLQP
jgi:YVTN family beta-propeller protein